MNDKIKGFPIIQNQQDFLISKFKISQIFKFTRYTKRILNGFDEEGQPIYNGEIQREVENNRVKKIADFLIEDPEATFPTNIVLHIPEEAIEKREQENDLVEITLKNKVFSEISKKSDGHVYITIIDGQHRIRGIEVALDRIVEEVDELTKITEKSANEKLLKKLKDRRQRLQDLRDIELVVSFFIDKTIEYQAMIFSTINRTQKRVSQSLVYDLFGLDTGDTPHKTALQTIISLNNHPKSPFYHRIKFYGGNYSGEVSPPLTQASVAKAIVNLISENLRESERDRNRDRDDLKKRSESSNKFLPFRKFYAIDKDNYISDAFFYFFTDVKQVFTIDSVSLWEFDNSSQATNILHTTVGFDALLKIMVEIFKYEEIRPPFNKESFNQFVNRIGDINVLDTSKYTFNNRGKQIFYLEMSLLIWPVLPGKDNRQAKLKELLQ